MQPAGAQAEIARILRVADQAQDALDLGDQAVRDLARFEVGANQAAGLASAQGGIIRIAPAGEYSQRPFPKAGIEWVHLLCQVVQRTAKKGSHAAKPSGTAVELDADNSERVCVTPQRKYPLGVDLCCDDLFHDRIAKLSLASEVMKEGAFGETGAPQDCIEGGALEAVEIDLQLPGLQEGLPGVDHEKVKCTRRGHADRSVW